ncbi:unnamed protein product [Medioppia subpectinata]|uniref:Protein kinase domain-containing protein n=1 Tax=Medioppia subpectinata TaxID=1979941 RepID=A0A7R9KBI6_9ACAR|nr:unnamed protein product [Medioppia subpectinata]CAG2100264.1 unnamed protein product [Medioppia subpectinata]
MKMLFWDNMCIHCRQCLCGNRVTIISLWVKNLLEEMQQNVLQEVKILSKLNSKFVVKFYNSWIESSYLYIQMEYCSQSLKQILKDKAIVFATQPEEPINSIFKEILECVQYLHECKPPIIHRDIKPDNILLTYDSTNNRFIKLCDFGLATNQSEPSIRDNHSIVGTIRYIAPEVYSGRYNHKSDIYSLNVVGKQLFHLDLK